MGACIQYNTGVQVECKFELETPYGRLMVNVKSARKGWIAKDLEKMQGV